MHKPEWTLFEEGGDLFLLRSGAPLVFEVALGNSAQWTWPELNDFLDRCLDGRRPELQKPLPITCFTYRELLERLSGSTTLVTWIDGAEVGRVNRDELPEVAETFLQQVDAPTYQAREERRRLKEQGLSFDGAWMPQSIRQVLAILQHAGVGSGSAPWLFQERETVQHGKLVSLHEITRSGWGFALRALDQQEVIRELEAFLNCLSENRVPVGKPQ